MNLSYANIGDAYAHEAITVADTAIGCTEATYDVAGQRGPSAALVSTEDAEIRYRIDGTNPTSTTGHLLSAGESIVLTGPNVQSLKMIRTGAASATVRVTFLR